MKRIVDVIARLFQSGIYSGTKADLNKSNSSADAIQVEANLQEQLSDQNVVTVSEKFFFLIFTLKK